LSGFSEYASYDATELAALVRSRDVTPRELVEEAIARIERLNPQLNAVIHPMYDEARRIAAAPLSAGPFTGVPFLLKDLLSAYAGAPYSAGSALLDGYRPDHDSEVVRRYKRAGVITLGKTNTPEFGLTPFTEPARYGPTRNPWDPTRTPGGSSGGSGAAVAARMVPMAGGGDGGGSIRIPASCCGLFGLKPTRARVPTGPDYGALWQGAVVEHVLTRSVRDSAAMLDAIAGPDVGAPYVAPPPARAFLEEVGARAGRLRIAFTSTPILGHSVHADCLTGLRQTVSLLESLGHELHEAAPTVDRERFNTAFLTMICGELRADLDDAERVSGRKASASTVEPATWALALLGRQISAGEFVSTTRYLQRVARAVSEFFEQYDLLLTPTLAEPPVPIGSLQPQASERIAMTVLGRLNAGGVLKAMNAIESAAEKVFDFVPYPPLFNVTGQPAMSVPLHWNDAGLPIGMQFAARFGDEAMLFRLAAQLEEAQPWKDRVPSISVIPKERSGAPSR
jgi:amidase